MWTGMKKYRTWDSMGSYMYLYMGSSGCGRGDIFVRSSSSVLDRGWCSNRSAALQREHVRWAQPSTCCPAIPKWMVCNGKSYWNRWFGAIYLYFLDTTKWCLNHRILPARQHRLIEFFGPVQWAPPVHHLWWLVSQRQRFLRCMSWLLAWLRHALRALNLTLSWLHQLMSLERLRIFADCKMLQRDDSLTGWWFGTWLYISIYLE